MIFISENFTFDNISNKDIGVDLITFDNDFFKEIGLSYSEEITPDGNFSSNPYYIKNVGDTEDIVLNLARVNKYGDKIRWDEESLTEVVDWLITDSFRPFVSEDNEDIYYYFKAKKIVKKFTVNMEGYLEVTFKPYTNYGYNRVEITGNPNISINNISNIDKSYKPVMRILNVSNELIIKNETNVDSEPFKLVGASGDVTIDFSLGTVMDSNGKNLFSKCNRKWISLNKGINRISVIGGKATIICEFPIIR